MAMGLQPGSRPRPQDTVDLTIRLRGVPGELRRRGRVDRLIAGYSLASVVQRMMGLSVGERVDSIIRPRTDPREVPIVERIRRLWRRDACFIWVDGVSQPLPVAKAESMPARHLLVVQDDCFRLHLELEEARQAQVDPDGQPDDHPLSPAKIESLRQQYEGMVNALNFRGLLGPEAPPSREWALDGDGLGSLSPAQHLLQSTVTAFVEAVESRHPSLQGHSERVSQIAQMIGRELGLPDTEVEGLHLAGLLHDIGMTAVPDRVMLKPGPLNGEEFTIDQQHCERAAHILEALEFPWEVKPAVRHHHEHWDGSGYPHGLKGEDIPLGARIIGVADVYVAMTSPRVYRPAHPPAAAFIELFENAGRKYDPKVVDALFTGLKAR